MGATTLEEAGSKKQISREEVAKNNTEDSLWIVVDHRYDQNLSNARIIEPSS